MSDTFDALATLFERYLDGALCSALLLDPDGITLQHRSASSLPAAYCGQLVIIEDIATDPLWTDYRDLALAHGLRICWTIPILSSQSRQVLGTLPCTTAGRVGQVPKTEA